MIASSLHVALRGPAPHTPALRRRLVMAALFLLTGAAAATAEERLPWQTSQPPAPPGGQRYDGGYGQAGGQSGGQSGGQLGATSGGYGDAYRPPASEAGSYRPQTASESGPYRPSGDGAGGDRYYDDRYRSGEGPPPPYVDQYRRGDAPPPYQGDRYTPPSGANPPYEPPRQAYGEPYGRGYGDRRPYRDDVPRQPEFDRRAYSQGEIVSTGHRFFGSVSSSLASVIEYAFKKSGRPNGYILGEDAGGAFIAGLRYGEGVLYTKDAGTHKVYWQGPSVGYDFGAEGSKTMVLVYNLRHPSEIYTRFGGVQGSAYVIGGVGIQFQKYGDIVLAPIRSGIGLRLGANVGYLKYTRRPTWNPF